MTNELLLRYLAGRIRSFNHWGGRPACNAGRTLGRSSSLSSPALGYPVMDASEVCLQNYRTALDQAQRYLTLTLGSAVGVWLLRADATNVKVTVPGTFVEVDWETARVLLLGFHFVIGALAGYTVETGRRIASALESKRFIAVAMYDYPSIPCSPWPLVRLAIPIASIILLALTQVAAYKGLTLTFWLVVGLIFSVHGTLISYLWTHSNGEFSPSNYNKPRD